MKMATQSAADADTALPLVPRAILLTPPIQIIIALTEQIRAVIPPHNPKKPQKRFTALSLML